MALTLLQLIDQVCGELSLTQPTVIVGSGNNQVKQFQALVQRLGRDLIREFEWQRLVKQYVFQTTPSILDTCDSLEGVAELTNLSSATAYSEGWVISGEGIPPYAEWAGQTGAFSILMNIPATATANAARTFALQDYALPTDFDRMISDTNWDRSQNWKSQGSKTSQAWQWLTGSVVAPTLPFQFRVYQNKLRLFPAPTAVYNLAYEYVSNYWIIAFGNTAATKSTITADTDTFIFPDDLLQAGLKYYFLKAKKLDFAVEMAEYAEILSVRKGQDVPIGKTSMAPRYIDPLVVNIPEGNW